MRTWKTPITVTLHAVVARMSREASRMISPRRRGAMTLLLLILPLLFTRAGIEGPLVASSAVQRIPPIGIRAQTPIPCSLTPNTGLPGDTFSATISLGPHALLSPLMMTMNPAEMQAATSLSFSPIGVQAFVIQTTYTQTQQVIYTSLLTLLPTASPGRRDLAITIQPPGRMPVGFICPRAFAIETPEERVQRANQRFREEVADALRDMGQQMGVPVGTDDFVASFDDDPPLVVNARIAGAEALPIEELARGADVLFVFLRVPQGSGLPSGFYVIRVSQEAGRWRAQFRDARGRIALETPMDVEIRETEQEAQKPKYKLTTKGKLIPPTLIVDWHKKDKKIEVDAQIEIPLGTGGPDGTPLPLAGQAILRATETFLSAARSSIAAGAKLTKADAARTIGAASTEETVIVWTYINGVERASIEELARGRPTIFVIAGDKIWLSRIWRDANGQWFTTNQFPTGESVTVPVEVSASGVSTMAPILLTDNEPDDLSPTLVTPAGITIKQKSWCTRCNCCENCCGT